MIKMASLDKLPDDTSKKLFAGNALAAFGRAMSDKINMAWTSSTGKTTSACYAISQIGCEPGSSIKQLSGMLSLEHSSLVRLLDHLERDGLINRVDNIKDKRLKNIYLSDAGEEMFTVLINERKNIIDQLTAKLDMSELYTLHGLVEKLMPAVVVGGDDQHYVCRQCQLEACPQEICPVNLCDKDHFEIPTKPFTRKVDSIGDLCKLVAAE